MLMELDFFSFPYRIVSEPSFALSLAALSDLGRIFFTTTYESEGDDFLCILAYDKIMTLLELEKNWQHRSLSAVARNMSNTANAVAPLFQTLEQDLINEARGTIIPGIRYIQSRFTEDQCLKESLQFFKACRFLNPARAQSLQPTLLNDISEVRCLNPTDVNELTD